MKRETRKEILDMSRKLFNQRGFNDVSIRDIATALGISNGNLTYYFKRKEEIVEALITEGGNGNKKPETAIQDLEDLDAFFLNMQRVVLENAFYFWHHAQLSQLSPKIHEKQKIRYMLNVQMLGQAFYKLKEDGFVRSERFPEEYARMIDALLISSIYWIPFCKLKARDQRDVDYHTHAWSITYQLLTEEGQAVADKILSKSSSANTTTL